MGNYGELGVGESGKVEAGEEIVQRGCVKEEGCTKRMRGAAEARCA
jgi:hypothetical protein